MEHVKAFKSTLSLVVATLTALWGWFGWLILIWILLMATDSITGTMAGVKTGKYKSSVAMDGIWKKVGSIIAVGVAALTDQAIAIIIENIPGISLPFEYVMMLSPLVVVWYLAAEAGSVLENLVNLGVDLPPFLKRVAELLKLGVETAGDDGFHEKENSDE